MDVASDAMSESTQAAPRPRDLALMLLARSDAPPRRRARDQEADRVGAAVSRRVFDRVAAEDPEPQALAETLARIVIEFGEPTGPTRAAALIFWSEWNSIQSSSGLWTWLLAEAIAEGVDSNRLRRKENRWSSVD